MPSFLILKDDRPHARVLLCAGLVSFIAFGLVGSFIGAGGGGHFADLTLTTKPDLQGSDPVSGAAEQESRNANGRQGVPAQASASELDPSERQRVVNAVAGNLERYYFDQVLRGQMAEQIRAGERRGRYNAVTDGAALASVLTRDVRTLSHDMHLEVVHSERTLPDLSIGPTPEQAARYREAMERENCGFEKVQMLKHGVGFIRLNAFADPVVCGAKAAAVMASLNDARALIFDLRENGGGNPEMVKLIANYLFDHPEYWYSPREAPRRESWTQSPVAGNRLADKPVFVLTSAATISGGEQFCYDLKMLKRATLVGETTHGSAHAGTFHRIDGHFGMGIPEAKGINPYAAQDWEGVGVEPTVRGNREDAMNVAERLADGILAKR